MWGYNYTTVGSSVHGILQARALEWVAISFSRESSQPRDWTRVSSIAGTLFTIWATREASKILNTQVKIPCATTKARCSQINKYSKKKKSFFQFLNSLLISYIYMCICAFIGIWLNLGKPLQTFFHMWVVMSQGISSYAVQWIILNILQIDHTCINQGIINASAPLGHNRRWAGTKKGKVLLPAIPKRRWPAIP